MRTISYLVPMAVLLAAAQTAQAQQVDCQSVQFSDRVTQKFPRVREACLDVIEREGQLMAVFKADLLRVQGNKVRIRPKLPGGEQAPAQTVQVPPERRVLVDGKKYRVDELSLGQELTIYARVDEPLQALAPAEETEPVEFVPVEVEPMRMAAAAEPEMPTTASELPAIGLLGVLLAALGVALEFVRRVLKLRSLMAAGVAGPRGQTSRGESP
ncbi:MAG TPA: hypothetical protein VGD45_25125 [Steroidobacter sp.]|uniref:hypothetical protein n=1 Tax=Steroidobacter sp. TaxID=1978227 RepID=UPI002EDA9B9F